MFSAPCEPGGFVLDDQDGDLTSQLITCPPDPCLAVGCPQHAFTKKGIQGCGIDTVSSSPGSEFTLTFVVWDRHVPPMMATADRVIRVMSPCSVNELYCTDIGARFSSKCTKMFVLCL